MILSSKKSKPGLYGYSTSVWEKIGFVNVYCPVGRIMLRIKTVEWKTPNEFAGTLMADCPAEAEWYELSWWDHFRLFVAKVFKRHNWPKKMFHVNKPKVKRKFLGGRIGNMKWK